MKPAGGDEPSTQSQNPSSIFHLCVPRRVLSRTVSGSHLRLMAALALGRKGDFVRFQMGCAKAALEDIAA